MSDEVWRFLAVLLFFAIVLVASYWFMLLPDHWTRRRRDRGQDRSKEVIRNKEGKEEGP